MNKRTSIFMIAGLTLSCVALAVADIHEPAAHTPVVQATPTPPFTEPKTQPLELPWNPWHYDFNPVNGTPVTALPGLEFCGYFPCHRPLSRFFNAGTGPVVQCDDGYFAITNETGPTCAQDGGVRQELYSH